MDKNPQNKDEALEALDFIVNVLKEHEKDLDKLINELATVTEQIGDTGELSSQVEKVEEKVTSLQKEVTSLVSYLSIIEPKDAKTIQQKQLPNGSNLPPSNANSTGSKRTFHGSALQTMGRLPNLSYTSSNAVFLF